VCEIINELHNWTPRILLTEAFHCPLAAMHRTVVHNPEDAPGIVVWWTRHHLFDQTVKWRDTIYRLAPAKHSGIVDI
jgi:hypothetical protein